MILFEIKVENSEKMILNRLFDALYINYDNMTSSSSGWRL
jgi:hypothetical protein